MFGTTFDREKYENEFSLLFNYKNNVHVIMDAVSSCPPVIFSTLNLMNSYICPNWTSIILQQNEQIPSTMSAIQKFRENNLESSRNVSETNLTP